MYQLCQGIRLSVGLIMIMIKHPIREYALSLKSVLTQTSVLRKELILGSGKKFIWVTAMGLIMRPAGVNYPGFNKFSDEGGKAIDGNFLNFKMNDLARDQFDYFMICT